jgi:cytoskeletal protein RodZ
VDHTDFGRYLSQQRELRGVSREELARLTKIPPTLLAALEDGQVERLPERVFVVHHVRAYARTLGLEEEEVLLRFQEVDAASGPPAEPAPAPTGEGRKRQALVALALLTLLVAAALAAYLALGGPPGAGGAP